MFSNSTNITNPNSSFNNTSNNISNSFYKSDIGYGLGSMLSKYGIQPAQRMTKQLYYTIFPDQAPKAKAHARMIEKIKRQQINAKINAQNKQINCDNIGICIPIAAVKLEDISEKLKEKLLTLNENRHYLIIENQEIRKLFEALFFRALHSSVISNYSTTRFLNDKYSIIIYDPFGRSGIMLDALKFHLSGDEKLQTRFLVITKNKLADLQYSISHEMVHYVQYMANLEAFHNKYPNNFNWEKFNSEHPFEDSMNIETQQCDQLLRSPKWITKAPAARRDIIAKEVAGRVFFLFTSPTFDKNAIIHAIKGNKYVNIEQVAPSMEDDEKSYFKNYYGERIFIKSAQLIGNELEIYFNPAPEFISPTLGRKYIEQLDRYPESAKLTEIPAFAVEFLGDHIWNICPDLANKLLQGSLKESPQARGR